MALTLGVEVQHDPLSQPITGLSLCCFVYIFYPALSPNSARYFLIYSRIVIKSRRKKIGSTGKNDCGFVFMVYNTITRNDLHKKGETYE